MEIIVLFFSLLLLLLLFRFIYYRQLKLEFKRQYRLDSFPKK